MKVNKTYLKGKSVFNISLIVIAITILTVYLTGINFNRSITSNLYLSLSIIATSLFTFITYGLFKGVGLIDDFPKFKDFKGDDSLSHSVGGVDFSNIDVGDGIGGLIVSIVLWIIMSIVFVFLLIILEAVFWFSIFIILAMLYWVFFRALKLVFNKSKDTKGDIGTSALYALSYTVIYIGWLFGIVYLTQILN